MNISPELAAGIKRLHLCVEIFLNHLGGAGAIVQGIRHVRIPPQVCTCGVDCIHPTKFREVKVVGTLTGRIINDYLLEVITADGRRVAISAFNCVKGGKT